MGIDRLLIEGLSACLGQTDLASSQIVDTVRDVGDNAGQLHLRQRAVCRNERTDAVARRSARLAVDVSTAQQEQCPALAGDHTECLVRIAQQCSNDSVAGDG